MKNEGDQIVKKQQMCYIDISYDGRSRGDTV